MARNAGCELDMQGCGPVVGRWDRLRLEQVVMNLVTNAIKYGGGHVEVRTGAGEEASLSVRDDGGGIAAEDQQRIFEPFGLSFLVEGARQGHKGISVFFEPLPRLVEGAEAMGIPLRRFVEEVGRLRKMPEGKELPVILMSAIDPALHPHGSWDRVQRKPFSLDSLLDTVQALLGA